MLSLYQYSIDGTESHAFLGRNINDGRHDDENCRVKVIQHRGVPHLCFFARKNIKCGDELRYNYGDDEKNLFWRKSVRKMYKA